MPGMSNEANTAAPLQQRIDAFQRLSREVSGAYRALEQRAAALEDELARSRREKERQRLEKERLAERLAALIDSLPGAVLVLDDSERVRESNALARDWFGDALTDQSWSALIAASALSEAEGGRELHGEHGRILSVSRRDLDDAGEAVVLVTDISEQRRLQRELEQNRKLATMGEMAARLAHQLRTPLSTAMLYASHLGGLALDRSRRQAFSDRLIARLRELDRMTRDMLGFVRGPSAEHAPLYFAPLADSLRAALEGAQPDGNVLEIGPLPAAPAGLHADAQALIPALGNLVENAWQAGARRVRLSVDADADGYWRLGLTDDGPGIDRDLAERVFEPFYSARPGGTGLGLPVARSVAEAHGGSLCLAERQPPRGARFEFRLPAARTSQAPRAATAELAESSA
ncbi:MAG: ATP-binding protein [Wenzhouxiangellaceae bacterium]|nr:ATP-binding protein [Wenzhouxiangellaceae bacterium]